MGLSRRRFVIHSAAALVAWGEVCRGEQEPILQPALSVPGAVPPPLEPSTPAIPRPEEPLPPVSRIADLAPRLWNLTDQPVPFQLGQRCGPPWSQTQSVAAGSFFLFDESVPDLQQIERLHLERGHAMIRYPDYGGLMYVLIDLTIDPANEANYIRFFSGRLDDETKDRLSIRLPYLFVIKDFDGYRHLIPSQPIRVTEPNGHENTPAEVLRKTLDYARGIQAGLIDPEPAKRAANLQEVVGSKAHVDPLRRMQALIANHTLVRERTLRPVEPCARPWCGLPQ